MLLTAKLFSKGTRRVPCKLPTKPHTRRRPAETWCYFQEIKVLSGHVDFY